MVSPSPFGCHNRCIDATASPLHAAPNPVPNPRLTDLANQAFGAAAGTPLHETQALVVARDGAIVFEQYGADHDEASTLISWSMAKSMVAIACGVLAGDGLLDIDAPAQVPEWSAPGDPRGAITTRHLLEMRSGLEWNEDYVDDDVSDVIEMLFGAGAGDMGLFAASKPLAAEPGAVWNYSSGTTNILCRILRDIVGGRDDMEKFLAERLFEPAGMTSPIPKFDDAGTWIGSSFVYATARDFVRFGELIRNRGLAGDQRVVDAAWIDQCMVDHAVDPDSGQGYGLQWWLARDEHGSMACNGYDGQRIQIVPDLGLTFVRLGKTPADNSDALRAFYADVVASFV